MPRVLPYTGFFMEGDLRTCGWDSGFNTCFRKGSSREGKDGRVQVKTESKLLLWTGGRSWVSCPSKGQRTPVCNAEGKRNCVFDGCSQWVDCLIFGWYLYWSALGCFGGSEDGFMPVMMQWHTEITRPGSMRYVRWGWAKQGRLTSPGRRQAQLRLSLSNKGSYGTPCFTLQ